MLTKSKIAKNVIAAFAALLFSSIAVTSAVGPAEAVTALIA